MCQLPAIRPGRAAERVFRQAWLLRFRRWWGVRVRQTLAEAGQSRERERAGELAGLLYATLSLTVAALTILPLAPFAVSESQPWLDQAFNLWAFCSIITGLDSGS